MEKTIIGLLVLLQAEVLIAAAVYARKRGGKHSTARGGCFIDTSVLIDGRIAQVIEAGFGATSMLVPESVLRELQYLADNGDADKRQRARHGLDIVKQLVDSNARVSVFDDTQQDVEVDDQLIALAKKYNGSICTIDFNLNKLASAQGIEVMNVNELAKNLRMNFLPGERVSIAITQKGSTVSQGVGYMSDGTMVVVEQASKLIGQTAAIEFIRSIQTDAGRMLFAKLVGQTEESTKKQTTKAQVVKKKTSGRQSPLRRRDQKPEDRLVELANS